MPVNAYQKSGGEQEARINRKIIVRNCQKFVDVGFLKVCARNSSVYRRLVGRPMDAKVGEEIYLTEPFSVLRYTRHTVKFVVFVNIQQVQVIITGANQGVRTS